MNGKGSKSRIANLKIFEENYESIEWREKGTYCVECGKTFQTKDEGISFPDENRVCVNCNFN